jgi:ribosomal protein S18 acetylase RimI-like enzyme
VSAEEIRQARPDDYDTIVAVVNEWWGRDVAGGLPRLFLNHFYPTSLIAEHNGTMAGFLIGFHSPGQPGEAYIHYVAVHPDHRRAGLARRLYDEFLTAATLSGCTVARAVTAPINERSIAFHTSMGFDVSGPTPDYDGPTHTMVTFTRHLTP